MIIVAPSILASDFSCLAHEVKKVTDAGAEYVHIAGSIAAAWGIKSVLRGRFSRTLPQAVVSFSFMVTQSN